MPLASASGANAATNSRHERIGVVGGADDGETTRLDARNVEQVIEHACHASDELVGSRGVRARFARRLVDADALGGKLRRERQGGEQAAQVVADDAEKIVAAGDDFVGQEALAAEPLVGLNALRVEEAAERAIGGAALAIELGVGGSALLFDDGIFRRAVAIRLGRDFVRARERVGRAIGRDARAVDERVGARARDANDVIGNLVRRRAIFASSVSARPRSSRRLSSVATRSWRDS